jgi:predicted dehydrogenase
MTEVRVAVLGGSGWMGKVHTMAYQTFPHFLGTSGGTARVVAIVEANAAAAEDLAARAPGARILQDWKIAVDDPDVDLIDICLPDSLHYEVAKAALLAGKHVYCEKPLANTAAEARELADIARAKGVITRVGHAFPLNPVHRLAKEIIDKARSAKSRCFAVASLSICTPIRWRRSCGAPTASSRRRESSAIRARMSSVSWNIWSAASARSSRTT